VNISADVCICEDVCVSVIIEFIENNDDVCTTRESTHVCTTLLHTLCEWPLRISHYSFTIRERADAWLLFPICLANGVNLLKALIVKH